jgi:hypothetical protein
MGNSGDQCLNTPPGQAVDETGCSASQRTTTLTASTMLRMLAHKLLLAKQ